MNENELYEEALPAEDDTDALAAESEKRRREGGADDTAAMQTVLCLILSVGLALLNMYRPELAEGLFHRICRLSSDTSDVMPNPIQLLADYFFSK